MKKFIVVVVVALCLVSIENVSAEKRGKTTDVSFVKPDDAYKPRVIGLFVGITQYKSLPWRDTLQYPEKDVNDMVAFFSNNDAVELDDKIVLTEPVETTRDYILNHAFVDLKYKNARKDDLVIVYFSGHGTLDNDTPYIVTHETVEYNVQDSAIPLNKVIKWFESLESKRRVLILDLCHSGLGKSLFSADQTEMVKSVRGIKIKPLKESLASIILSACPMGQSSYEDKSLENGVYTHFLLEGMRKGDLNNDGAITISEAHNYSIDKTQAYVWLNKNHRVQVPTAYTKILGKDPIIVNGTAREEGAPVLFSYASSMYGTEVYVDDVHKGILPKGFALSPGCRKVELKRNGNLLFRKQINLHSGQNYMLPDITHLPKASLFSNAYVFFEGGYQNREHSNIPDDLIPSGPVVGISALFERDRYLISGGGNFQKTTDLNEFALRVGLKFKTPVFKTNLYWGPDIHAVSMRYSAGSIDDKTVDDMFFICPGAEVLLAHELENKMILSCGLRAYLMPFELNGEKNNVLVNQLFISTGYSF